MTVYLWLADWQPLHALSQAKGKKARGGRRGEEGNAANVVVVVYALVVVRVLGTAARTRLMHATTMRNLVRTTEFMRRDGGDDDARADEISTRESATISDLPAR